MNKELTIVFNSYYSEKQLFRIIKKIKLFKILIIENSLKQNLKTKLEKKFKNVEVIIPKKNLGVAKACNLALKKTNTKYLFLNNPDIDISISSINKLLNFAKKNKKFGIISPTYNNEKIFRNYSSYEKKISSNISCVNWIDFNYLIKKSVLKKYAFDEKYFLYFENFDFCLKLLRNNEKLYVVKNIKFDHFGSKSVDPKLRSIVLKMRAWHYNWSKFYYYKKNFSYFYALTKILPNFIQALKKLIFALLKFDFFRSKLCILELYGIICSVFLLKSYYRALK